MDEAVCPNCGERGPGQYCSTCGQRRGEVTPSLRVWLSEALDEILFVEARLPRTLKALLWPIGHLTAEWWRGRRATYMSPLRLYLLAAVPFFIVATARVRGDDNEGFLEFVASVPALVADSSAYLPPQGPLLPDRSRDPAARDEWQREFSRIQEYNDSVSQSRDTAYARGVGRVFDLLPVAVGLVMVPLLGLILMPSVKRGFVASLIFSLHVHTVGYVLAMVGFLVGQGLWFGGGGALIYLGLARHNLFEESILRTTRESLVTITAYGLSFVGVFIATSLLLGMTPRP